MLSKRIAILGFLAVESAIVTLALLVVALR